ncbi:hypothetical protein MCOR15_004611 [Pyricularia oryzae]|nr:hypothetical protein MCOR15_004611 [Pyricularia oryzae]
MITAISIFPRCTWLPQTAVQVKRRDFHCVHVIRGSIGPSAGQARCQTWGGASVRGTRLMDGNLAVIQHMETYWKILKNKRGSQLRLTKIDDEIYEHLKKDFPELDPAVDIDEDVMKNKENKERWRKFLNFYDKKVEDFNFGTMLRKNPKDDVEVENRIIFVPRMQFYAFEIARNKAGLNDWIYEQEHPEEKKE